MKKTTAKPPANRPASSKAQRGSTTSQVLGLGLKPADAVKRIDPKWRWHYKSLLALKDRLLTQRNLRRAEGAQPLEPHSMDLADSATDEMDHDLSLTELSAAQDVLYEVDEAIKRILNGSYGVCEESGQPIPAARLRAVPWTRFGKEVEARLEDKGVLSNPHLGALGSVRAQLTGDLEESESEEAKARPEPEDESLRPVPSPPLQVPGPNAMARPHGNRGTPAKRGGRRAKDSQ